MALVDAAPLRIAEHEVSPLGKGPCSEPVVDSESELLQSAATLGRGSIGTGPGHIVADSGSALSSLVSAGSLRADGDVIMDGTVEETESIIIAKESEVFSDLPAVERHVCMAADVQQNGGKELQNG